MKLLVGNMEFSDLLKEKLQDAGLILFRYGPGSAGDILLKQFLAGKDEESHAVYISTHESLEEMRNFLDRTGDTSEIEIISLLEDLSNDLERTAKKDHFRTDGILVTDLLEISYRSDQKRERTDTPHMILSRLTTLSERQVLPFHMVIDSLHDIVSWTSEEEVVKRLRILKKNLMEKRGRAIIAAPLKWSGVEYLETTLFDAVLSACVTGESGTLKRIMKLENAKGSIELPQVWDITSASDIPVAQSLD